MFFAVWNFSSSFSQEENSAWSRNFGTWSPDLAFFRRLVTWLLTKDKTCSFCSVAIVRRTLESRSGVAHCMITKYEVILTSQSSVWSWKIPSDLVLWKIESTFLLLKPPEVCCFCTLFCYQNKIKHWNLFYNSTDHWNKFFWGVKETFSETDDLDLHPLRAEKEREIFVFINNK